MRDVRDMGVKLRRKFLRSRTAISDSGGVISDGPFEVRLQNFRLRYREENRSLTIPVEMLKGNPDYAIGTALIRHWDVPMKVALSAEIETIKANINAALVFLKVRFV